MASKLIKLEDGTLVEVEIAKDEAQQIAGGVAKKVDTTLEKIKPVLLKICQPVAASVKTLRDDVDLEQVEVEVALSFDLEGNIYVAKTNFGANILVRMTLKKQTEIHK
jgi:hypothetical protein